VLCAISGFHREAGDNCALLGYYVASSGNSLTTFRDKISISSSGFLTLEDETDRLSRNVAKELPLLAA
jgi:hypothetical protein